MGAAAALKTRLFGEFADHGDFLPFSQGQHAAIVLEQHHDVRMSMIQVRISKTAMLEMMMNRDCREDGRLAWKPEKVAVIVLHFAPSPAIIIKLLRKTERMLLPFEVVDVACGNVPELTCLRESAAEWIDSGPVTAAEIDRNRDTDTWGRFLAAEYTTGETE